MSATVSVIEFLCNLRWVLSYAVQRLDPVLEAHYKHVLDRARQAESDVSRSYASVNSLAGVCSDALSIAQEGIVYLLVAESVLGHSPPTMHSFLLRATTPTVSGAVSNSTGCSDTSSQTQLQSSKDFYQAHFVCIRWLIAEGLLTEEELLDSLGGEMDVSAHGEQSRFELHVSIAKRLSNSNPFAIQTHVLITRSLILHYCCTIVSANDIVSHVQFLDPMCRGRLENIEDTLLFWIHHLIKVMHDKKYIDSELYRTAMEEMKGSLYQTVKSGVILGLVVYFYKKTLLPLTQIRTGVRDGKTITLCREDRLHNWGSLLRVSEELGLWPCLYADEVEQYGEVVLQLNVLRFLEELFAVLATQAEDVQEEAECEEGINVNNSVTPQCIHRNEEEEEKESKNKMNGNNLNHCPAEKDDDGDSSSVEDEGGAAGGGPSLSSSHSFPSAHSRRQYDVMMASLHLHEAASKGASDSLKSNGSSTKLCPSRHSNAAIATSYTSSNAACVLSRRPSRSFSSERRMGSENPSKTDLVHSPVENTQSVMDVNKVHGTDPNAVNSSHSSCVVKEKEVKACIHSPNVSNSSANALALSNEGFKAPPPMQTELRKASYRYDPNSCLAEKNLTSLSPLTTTVMEMQHGLKTMTSCTSTESSFHINLLEKLGSTHANRERTNAFMNTSSSGSYSSQIAQEEAMRQGVSPMTPDTSTPCSVVLSKKALTTSNQQHRNSPPNQKQLSRSDKRLLRETELRDLLRDLSGVDPSLFSGTSDRHSLLMTLEKQQAMIQLLAGRLATVKGENPLRLDESWSENDGASTISDVRVPARFFRYDVDSQTDDSGQRAETDISSIPDDCFDGEGSFVDY